MNDHEKGLYNKYTVIRNDGSSEVGGKHQNCNYFVLDLTHDRFAAVAIAEYARACQHEFPKLAVDLKNLIADLPFGILPREYSKCPKCDTQLIYLIDEEEKTLPNFQKAYCSNCQRPFLILL